MMMNRLVHSTVAALAVCCTAQAAFAAGPITRLTNSDGAAGDLFGQSVDIHGSLAIVGAVEADAPGANSGAAYILRWDGLNWVEEAKLTASDGAAGDFLGYSVAISGDTAVVGAVQNAGQGAAYVYRRSAGVWSQEQKLTASGATTGFGAGVDIDGDTIIVGATGENSSTGAAYLYTRSGGTWIEQQRLTASDAVASGLFGAPVALDGASVLIGARLTSAGPLQGGAGYVFTRAAGVWTEQAKLRPADPESGQSFGTTLALDGDTALIGAGTDDGGGLTNTGAAYFFERSAGVWSQTAKLTAPDPEQFDSFGGAVDLEGDTAVIVETTDNADGVNAGALHIYTRENGLWGRHPQRSRPVQNGDDIFGIQVAISGDAVIAGVPLEDVPNFEQGAAYIFERVLGPTSEREQQLLSSDPAAGDRFGAAVDVEGDTMVIGATNANAAYVFERAGAGWAEVAILTASDAAPGDAFGAAIDIQGDTLVIGAGAGDGVVADTGAVYVFTRSAGVWTEQAKLTASDGAILDAFGGDLALDGDTILIGARLAEPSGVGNDGAAYIFTGAGASWTEQQKLTASDGGPTDFFGGSVDLIGDTAFIGASGRDGVALDSGGVYIFTRSGSTWTEQTILEASDAAPSAGFGSGVSVSGGTLAIGAFGATGAAPGSGAAYIFTGAGASWSEQTKLVAGTGAAGDEFGAHVDLVGTNLLIGAPNALVDGVSAGAAHHFVNTAGVWSERRRLSRFDPSPGSDEFGAAVAAQADTLVVGAFLDDSALGNAGAVSVFDRRGEVWTGSGFEVFDPNGAIGDDFGAIVNINGDKSIVGAQLDDELAPSAGAAYIYTRTGGVWTLEQKLLASDGVEGDLFGAAVAVDGDWAIVGATAVDDGAIQAAGAVYFFERVGGVWIERQKILRSDFEPTGTNDRLGAAVAISGEWAIATASGGDTGVSLDTGVGFLFQRTNGVWSVLAGIFAPDGQPGDQFGVSVALDGVTNPFDPRAVVGASSADGPGGANQGAAYFYRGTADLPNAGQKVFASDGAGGDGFGQRVDFDGDTAIIGASQGDGVAPNSGAAYLFTDNGATWTEQQKLFASDGATDDFFGWSVAIDGDAAVVSADSDDDFGADSGSAYLFVRDGANWVEASKLNAPDAAEFEYFSWSVDIDGGTILVGAESGTGAAQYSGSAYFFETAAGFNPNTSVRNFSAGTTDANLPAALASGGPNDLLSATYGAFRQSALFDFAGSDYDLASSAEIRTPGASVLTLTDGAALSTPSGRFAHFDGGLALPAGAAAMIEADDIHFGPGGVLSIGINATLDGSGANSTRIDRAVTLLPGAALLGGDSVVIKSDLTLAGAVLSANAATTNDAAVVVQDVSQILGNYINNGTTTIQNGTLTVLGALIDNGSIVGDFASTRAGGGFFVENDYRAGAASSLTLLGGTAKFGANADIAINSNTRYDMASSEIRMVGLAGTVQTLERMSADIGPSPDGLDRTLPGHYPIDTLRIGPDATTVDLVDNHDNDNLGQAQCEAIYVRHLVIDAGATLNTNGCPIYYETLTNNGSVDNLANLVQIAQCAADLTGDGQVDGADLGLLLGSWGTAQGDLTGDGNTDGADLGLLLGAWGACP